MEKFSALPAQKQNKIIDAALMAFGTNGYKKASVSDIASAAGISKSMVFHYFGTKIALYFYLLELCGNLLMDELNEKLDKSVTDFFERVRLGADIKISVMNKHSYFLSFLNSVYFESDEEVRPRIEEYLAKGEAFRADLSLVDLDASKFKQGIDPKIVMKMLTWLSKGYLSEFQGGTEIDIEAFSKEFDNCLCLLKSNFYKEEEL